MIKCYYIYNYNFFYNVCQYFPRQKNDVKLRFIQINRELFIPSIIMC